MSLELYFCGEAASKGLRNLASFFGFQRIEVVILIQFFRLLVELLRPGGGSVEDE